MPDSVQDLIRAAAKQHGVPTELALAVAEQESGFNPTVTNPQSGAIGTFQFLPSTAKTLGIDPNDPRQNIDGGVKYLRQLLDRHQGDIEQVLAEYGGVKNDTNYVPAVQKRIMRFKRGISDQPAQTTPPPVAATAGMLPQDTLAGPAPTVAGATAPVPGVIRRFGSQFGQAAIVEPLKGVAGLAETTLREGPVAAAKQAGRAIVGPTISGLKAATKARKEGRPLDWVKDMVSAIPLYGPVLSQAGSLAASGDVAGAAGRLAGGVLPIAGVAKTAKAGMTMLPGARAAAADFAEASAARSMTKLFTAAADGSEAAEREIQNILPLALDKSLLRVTRGGWAKAVRESMKVEGAKVGEAVKGPLGDTVVPIDPPVQALEHLRDTVTNYVPVDESGTPIGAAAAKPSNMLTAVPFNERLISQIDKAVDILKRHGPTVHIRQLVNLRRDWDDFVYHGKQWLNKDDMVTQYEARAKSAATDAIRGIIDQDPRLIDLAQVDKAYSLHADLYKFIADEAFGRGHAIPYYPGFGLKNAVTRRMFSRAVQSPTWKLLGIKGKLKLAEAMANNSEFRVRNLLRPLLAGGVVAVGRSEDDLPTQQLDEQLVGGLQSPAP